MDEEVRRYAAIYELTVVCDPERDIYKVGRGHDPQGPKLYGAREALVYAIGFTHGEYIENKRCNALVSTVKEVVHG